MSKKKEPEKNVQKPEQDIPDEIGPNIPGHTEVSRFELDEKTREMAVILSQKVDSITRAESLLKKELTNVFQEKREASGMLAMYVGSVTELQDKILASGNWVLWTDEDQVFVSEVERVRDSE